MLRMPGLVVGLLRLSLACRMYMQRFAMSSTVHYSRCTVLALFFVG